MYAFLRRHLPAVIALTSISIILGAVSASVFSSIGPAMQLLLTTGDSDQVSLDTILGKTLAELLVPYLGQSSFSRNYLWQLVPAFILVTAFVRAILLMIHMACWEWLSEKFARKMRKHIVEHFLYLNPSSRRANGSFDEQLSSSIGQDLRVVREYMVHFYGGLPRELLQLIFYLLTLVVLSPKLFAVFVLGLLPLVSILTRLGKKLRHRSAHALDYLGLLSEWIQQRLRGIETIKHYASEAHEANRMQQHTQNMLSVFLKVVRVKARTAPITEFIAAISLAVVFYVSFEMIRSEQTSSSVLLSFFAVLAGVSQSAGKLARYYNSNREGAAAKQRIEQLVGFLEANQQVSLLGATAEGSELLVLDNLSVFYPSQSEPALKGFSHSFRAGKIYCICGSSGAGKSTLMNTLLGLNGFQSGRLIWSNKKTNAIGYVPQKIELTSLSLGENVSYPEKFVDSDRLKEALQMAGLAEFSLTPFVRITEGGAQISGGQAQRLMIARLFYHRYECVLVDEATSALDPETEALVYRSLKTLAHRYQTCIIMIAHRSSAFEFADELVLLEKGELVAKGNYKQMLNISSFKRLLGQKPD